MVKRKAADVLPTVILFILALAVAAPVVVIIVLSLSDGVGIYADLFVWNPRYVNALSNSLIISFCVSFGTIIVSVLAAYVFAKVKFKGRDVLFYLYIIVMMMPFQVTVLPQYIVSRKLDIYDSYFALILPGIFAPFAVFLLTQIMKSLPDEMIEAARLDTSSTIRIIASIIVPSIKNGIICAWAITFTEQWNLVAEPLILIESEERLPLSVMLNEIETGDILGFAAVAVFACLPFLIYTFFESEIIEGLEAYRLK